MPTPLRPPGYTLPELLAVLVLAGILATLAAPALDSLTHGIRRRGALDRVTGDLYRARVLAVRSGAPVEVRFLPPGPGCVEAYALARDDGSELSRVRVGDEAPGVCLRVRGASTVRIDARGLPRGAMRTLTAELGRGRDSLHLSLVGRVVRFY